MEEWTKREKVLAIFLVGICLVSLGSYLGYAVAASTRAVTPDNIVLMDDLDSITKTSSLPWDNITDTAPIGPYNFMISTFTNDTATYYQATNGTDGKILDSWTSTNASNIIQNALNSLTLGRGNKETVKLTGYFILDSKINMTSYTILNLVDAKIYFADNSNSDLISVSSGTGVASYVEIVGGYIDFNGVNQAAGNVISWLCSNGKIIDTQIWNPKDSAIYVSPGTSSNAMENVFDRIRIRSHVEGCIGITYAYGSTDNFLTNSLIAGNTSHSMNYGVNLNSAAVQINTNHFWGVKTCVYVNNTSNSQQDGNYYNDYSKYGVHFNQNTPSVVTESNIISDGIWRIVDSDSCFYFTATETNGIRDTSVTGNTFYAASDNGEYVLDGYNTTGLVFTGNTLRNSYSSTFNSLATSTSLTISNNEGLVSSVKGTYLFSGTGTQKEFSIPIDMDLPPSSVKIVSGSSATGTNWYVSNTASTYINITYIAPFAGLTPIVSLWTNNGTSLTSATDGSLSTGTGTFTAKASTAYTDIGTFTINLGSTQKVTLAGQYSIYTNSTTAQGMVYFQWSTDGSTFYNCSNVAQNMTATGSAVYQSIPGYTVNARYVRMAVQSDTVDTAVYFKVQDIQALGLTAPVSGTNNIKFYYEAVY